MDENLHSIDDLFKKAIDDHDEVPSSKVWENIDKNLDKKKVISITKKYEKWKWVAAALFIFSVGMAMYTLNLKLRYKGGGGGGNRPSPGDTIKSLAATTNLQYLAIPAGLRYHFTTGKFSFNPAFALSANFVTKKKFETVLLAAGGNENTTTSDIQGLKSAYFDGSLRTDLVYNLSRTIGISLIPSARFALSSMTKDGPVKTYVNTFGLGVGLNVHF